MAFNFTFSCGISSGGFLYIKVSFSGPFLLNTPTPQAAVSPVLYIQPHIIFFKKTEGLKLPPNTQKVKRVKVWCH
jgi:hypothetical protein